MGNMIRSKAYPSMNLREAVRRTELFAKNLGKGSFSREETVMGMGYKGLSGASARAVAALVHFGLLERHKAKYALSAIGHSIAYPIDENAKAMAIKEAVLRPVIIKDVREQYGDQELPDRKFLANVLTTEKYGINPKQKDEVADIIIASLEYAGELSSSTELIEVDGMQAPAPYSSSNENNEFQAFIPTAPATQQEQMDVNKLEIVLREGVKAGIYAPYNLTEAEKNKLKSLIDIL